MFLIIPNFIAIPFLIILGIALYGILLMPYIRPYIIRFRHKMTRRASHECRYCIPRVYRITNLR